MGLKDQAVCCGKFDIIIVLCNVYLFIGILYLSSCILVKIMEHVLCPINIGIFRS